MRAESLDIIWVSVSGSSGSINHRSVSLKRPSGGGLARTSAAVFLTGDEADDACGCFSFSAAPVCSDDEGVVGGPPDGLNVSFFAVGGARGGAGDLASSCVFAV